MKKAFAAAEELAEKLALPEDALLNSMKISLTGDRRVFIENHKGILEYSPDRIVVAGKRGRLGINGAELSLLAMNGAELAIVGRIRGVEWE